MLALFYLHTVHLFFTLQLNKYEILFYNAIVVFVPALALSTVMGDLETVRQTCCVYTIHMYIVIHMYYYIML